MGGSTGDQGPSFGPRLERALAAATNSVLLPQRVAPNDAGYRGAERIDRSKKKNAASKPAAFTCTGIRSLV